MADNEGISLSRYLKKPDWLIEQNSQEHERMINMLKNNPPPWFDALSEIEQNEMIAKAEQEAKAGTELLDSRLKEELARGTLPEGMAKGILEEIWPLLGSGLKQKEQNKKNATGSRKKPLAVELAADLKKEYEDFHTAWESIPEDGTRAYLKKHPNDPEKDRVCFNDGNREYSLGKESFRTGYWVKTTIK